MKKFKVVEEGRILSHAEQNKITGGLGPLIGSHCSTLKGHNSCASDWSGSYESCVRPALAGYHVTVCDWGGTFVTCGSDMIYESSSCSGLKDSVILALRVETINSCIY